MAQKASKRPFWAQQRPRYLLSNKMTCGECGSAYAKAGKHRFRCMGYAKKVEVYCSNDKSIRQDELDRRVLTGLEREMMQEEILHVFQQEYAAELARLSERSDSLRPAHELEHREKSEQLNRLKAAILKGVDPSLFVEELNQLQARLQILEQALSPSEAPSPLMASVLRPDLADIYRSKVSALTSAFEDEALRADAFERIRALIESVIMTPEGNELAVLLRGELAAMLELCDCDQTQKPPADGSEGVLQIKVVAGVGFDLCRTRFRLTDNAVVPPYERL